MADLSVINPQNVAGTHRTASWGTAILPYTDQANLYQQINFSLWYLHPDNQSAASKQITFYTCPSNPEAKQKKPNGDRTADPERYGRNDYTGNWGVRAFGCPTSWCTNTYQWDLGESGYDPRGPLVSPTQRNISSKSVTDGLSNTIFIGEAPTALHGIWAGQKNLQEQAAPINAKNSTVTSAYSQFAACTVYPWVNSSTPYCDFGQEYHSYHSGGAHFLLGDGSTRMISQEIDLLLFNSLLSIRDGKVIGEF